MMMVYITEEVEAYHRYKDAPEEVSFLRDLHRHMFKVRIFVEVDESSDREIEFIMLKHRVREWLRKNVEMREIGSCEWLAKLLAVEVRKIIGAISRKIVVDVSEDGENGVIYVYEGE